jgi:hypothetical protein
MLDDVKQRLTTFGYALDIADDWVLEFIIQKVTNHIQNKCNIVDIPEGVHQMAVDMVVGEFLMGKKASGQLNESDILKSDAVTSLKMGDTQINFGEDKTPSQQLDSLIVFLLKGYEADFVSYRRMKW